MKSVAPRSRLPAGAAAWSLFEGARNPYIVLVVIYVFMPYFSSTVVGDPVRGQQAVATYGEWAGVIVALTAPVLGASIDRIGPRKPLLLVVVAAMTPLIASLWFARPGGQGLSVGAVIVIAAAINVLFAWSEVLHNSMLVRAAGLRHAHAASGLALALGNLIAVSALVFVLAAFVIPAATHHTPLFGLDAARFEPARITAPIAALIFALGAWPLFVFTPDAPPGSVSVGRALVQGAGSIGRMLKSLRGRRDATTFLLARMLYIDAMTGVLLFSGVYAGGVMHWGVTQLLAYGILLSVTAVLGGFAGAALDHRLGPKRAVQLQIAVVALGLVLLLGIAPDRLFLAHGPELTAPVWAGPIFRSRPELVYLAIAATASVFITASYASSRTLLTRLTPPEETGTFFGLYALSGTATVWAGSALVLVATRVTHTQQAGFAALAVLMVAGLALVSFVRGGGRPSPGLVDLDASGAARAHTL